MITLAEFAREAAAAGAVYSRHYDEIAEAADLCQAVGHALFEQSANLLASTAAAFQAADLALPNHLLVVVPLPSSQSIDLLERENWDGVRVGDEPPGLYAVFSEDIFGLGDEEYRRPVEGLVGPADPPLVTSTIYRSWRSAAARRDGWEFGNDVYLIWTSPSVS